MKRIEYKKIFAICSLFMVWLFAIWKTRLGIHSDEVHSIAVGDMIANGNVYFKECWFYLQMSAVYTSPLIYLYETINGSTEGILYFFRILSVCIQTGIVLYFYFTFSKGFNKKYVAIAAILLFVYVPDFQSFNYKQEMIWFSIMQIIFLYRYYKTGYKKYLIGLGIMIAGNVLSYPTTIIQFPVFLGLIYKMEQLKGNKEKKVIKSWLLITGVCAICASLFILIVLKEISIEEFIEFFPVVFTDENLDSSFIAKLFHPLKKFILLGLMTWLPLIICEKINYIKRFIKRYQIPIVSIILWMAFLGQCYIEREGVTWHCITYPYSITLFLLPLLCKIKSNKGKEIFFLFEIPAIIAVLCIALASNQGNITSMYGTIISLIGMVMLIGERNELRNKLTIEKEKKWIVISLLFMALAIYGITVYEQESVEGGEQNTRTIWTPRTYVSNGPAKGMYLGEKIYSWYNDICAVTDKYVDVEDAVLIIDNHKRTAFGYLNAKGDYATFSPQGGWGLDTSQRVEKYFKANPHKMPTVVLINLEYINMEIEKYLSESFPGVFLSKMGFQIIDEEKGYIVLRQTKLSNYEIQ